MTKLFLSRTIIYFVYLEQTILLKTLQTIYFCKCLKNLQQRKSLFQQCFLNRFLTCISDFANWFYIIEAKHLISELFKEFF